MHGTSLPESTKKTRGRPKGSKNKLKDPTTIPAKTQKVANTPVKNPCAHAIYSSNDDRTLLDIFLVQKQEGNQTSNGGWKSKAITAAVVALKDSEKESGGTPKTASSICDHWVWLKAEYQNFNKWLSKSGWGWDEENQCVQASDEQWEGLGEGEAHLKVYKGKTFPIYSDMDGLLNGAHATGSYAFHAGKDDNTGDSDSDTNSVDSHYEADADTDTSLGSIIGSQSSSQTNKKCKSAFDTPVPQKHSRHDRTGKATTSESLSQMSRAIEMAAAAMDTSSDDKSVVKKAIALVSATEQFSKSEKVKLLLHISHDTSLANLLLSVNDTETCIEIMHLQLE